MLIADGRGSQITNYEYKMESLQDEIVGGSQPEESKSHLKVVVSICYESHLLHRWTLLPLEVEPLSHQFPLAVLTASSEYLQERFGIGLKVRNSKSPGKAKSCIEEYQYIMKVYEDSLCMHLLCANLNEADYFVQKGSKVEVVHLQLFFSFKTSSATSQIKLSYKCSCLSHTIIYNGLKLLVRSIRYLTIQCP
ncbi:hypothetical protein FGO68_gene4685 [Halteria grandinella]|uniref:Uncharacterized protein n=1 Tax=Halteria grandinella TaxID=5974 RepID=A0A8J8T1T1_HALGN|nr:hypothetical protein FGO68_gene4685 [Halteria grandinella]